MTHQRRGLFCFRPGEAALAVKTFTEQLESCQTAIAKIEGGAQSYTVDGVTYTRADLATLYAREERLLGLVGRETSGGMRVRLARPL